MTDRYEYPHELMWYVAHTYSGYENKVKANLDKSIQNLHLEESIKEVRVPMEETIEIKDGKSRTVQKKLFPGYVLIHMIMNDETWYVVRNTRGVTGFVGPESSPVPLTEDELNRFGISSSEDEAGETVESSAERPEKKIIIDIEDGDFVDVISGAWKGRDGIVRSVNPDTSTVTVGLDVFGRETMVDISLFDIRKRK